MSEYRQYGVKPVKLTCTLTRKDLLSKNVYRKMVKQIAEALVANCVLGDSGVLCDPYSDTYTFSIHCLAAHKNTDPSRLPE